MHAAAAWLTANQLTEVSLPQKPHANSPAHSNKENMGRQHAHMRPSTVLAQDHFFSDFLSLHLTSKTHKVSMMMVLGCGLPDFLLSIGCRLDEHLEPTPV